MDFLPKDLIENLRRAEKRTAGRKSRLRVHADGEIWPVLRVWHGGFALDADRITRLRGLVDLYEGGRHISTCLIIASDIENGELICTVKREQAVSDHQPLDFERDQNAPAALLPRF